MRITLRQLKNLSVETQSGVVLGKVKDVVLETEGQLIAQYVVKPSILSEKKYLISREQVLNITKDKMVVDDNVAKDSVKEEVKQEKAVGAEAVMMRK